MEEMYANDDSVCNITVVNDRGSSRSKKRLIVGLISLGILSVGLLIGLIRLGFLTHALSSSAAGLSGTKDNLTDCLHDSNDQISALTKERDQLNAALLERSNEVIRLQSLSSSWNKAREDCRNKGGDLVVINNDDEQNFVLTISVNSPWIGLSEETEGSWKWVDGTALSSEFKKFWGQGQPDNAGGIENCGQIWGNLKAWNDDDCDT
ncbi:hepatic lectin-like [Gambusia affinis]|uniref:hepatic lectin-like n=1 Tax=Gambusia affinis TaxID=33528 RepID=UPI001CDC8A23|nr:hepatic lectin-like [Gambusia affinis]